MTTHIGTLLLFLCVFAAPRDSAEADNAKLVQGDFKCACKFLERLYGRDGVAVLHAGGVTTKKSGTLLDVSLGEIFCFTELAESVADEHEGF